MSESMTPESLMEKRKAYMAPTLTHLYERPMNLVRGDMQHLYDSTGKEYLDFFAGICTVSVGHTNPDVNGAVIDQIGRLQHTSTVFLTEPMVNLAEKLAHITPGKLQKSFITNSGTEANETGLLLAKRFTKRNEIIALKHAYHGRSWLAASLTAIAAYRVDPIPVPGISFAENPYCYRCPFGQKPDSCGLECADDLEKVIQTQTTGQPAVFIAETIQGVGGIIVPPAGYFKRVREITNKYGMLLHIDEVQAGFGRTGTWFGIEHEGIEPDLISMAKGMGNGYAIGGVITTAEIADSLTAGTINTFGGNPISATASLAVIDYIDRHALMARATELGTYLMNELRNLQENGCTLIGEVRGRGLMIGVELVKDRKTKEPAMNEAKAVMELMKDDGVIVGRGGLYGCTLRLQPPMIVTKDDCDQLIASMKKALETVGAATMVA